MLLIINIDIDCLIVINSINTLNYKGELRMTVTLT